MPPIILEVRLSDQGVIQGVRQLGTEVDRTAQRINTGATQAFTQATTASQGFTRGLTTQAGSLQQAGQAALLSGREYDRLNAVARQAGQLFDAYGRVLPVVTRQTREQTTATEQAAQGQTRVNETTQQGSAAFSLTAGSALRYVAAITGVSVGLQTIGQVTQFALQSTVGFERTLAEVAATGIRNTQQAAAFRDQLLQLPPALGSIREFATSAFEAISAGVDSAQAIDAVRNAATLAKAGLSSYETATLALTKTQANFNIPLAEAPRTVDKFLTALDQAPGRFEEFAQGFIRSSQSASSLNLTFDDTIATMAVLSQRFANAQQASTGFTSFLNQLIINNEKFLAIGINVREILGQPGGYIALLERLRAEFGNNSVRLQQYIADSEGFRAAQVLLGTGLAKVTDQINKQGIASGSAAERLTIHAQTISEAYKTLSNTFEVLVNDNSNGFNRLIRASLEFAIRELQNNLELRRSGEAYAALQSDLETRLARLRAEEARRTSGLAAQAREIRLQATVTGELADALDASGLSLEEFIAQQLTLGRTLPGVNPELEHVQAILDTLTGTFRRGGDAATVYRDQVTKATIEVTLRNEELARGLTDLDNGFVLITETAARVPNSIVAVNEALAGMDEALRQLGARQALTSEQTQVFATTVVTGLTMAAASGAVSATQLQESYDKAIEVLTARLGTLPPATQASLDAVQLRINALATDGTLAFERLGLASRTTLVDGLMRDVQAVEAVLQTANFVPEEVLARLGMLIDAFAQAGIAIPEGLRRTLLMQLPAILEQAVREATARGEVLPANIATILGRVGTTLQAESARLVPMATTAGEDLADGYALGFTKLPAQAEAAFQRVGARVEKVTLGTFSNVERASTTILTTVGDTTQKFLTNTETVLARHGEQVRAGLTTVYGPTLQQIEGAFQRAFGTGIEESKRTTDQLVKDFALIRTRGIATPEAILKAYERDAQDIIAIFGKLPTAAKREFDKISQAAAGVSSDVLMAFREIGKQTPAELKTAADKALAAFKTIQEAGRDAFGQVRISGTEAGRQLADTYVNDVRPKIIAAYGEIPNELKGIDDRLVRQAQETGKQVGDGIADGTKAGTDKANAAIMETAMALTELQKLNIQAANAVFVQAFADTERGLLRQLEQARKELLNVPFISEVGAPGLRDFTRDRLLEVIDILEDRLADLREDDRQAASTPPQAPSAPGSGTTTPSPPTGGGGGSLAPALRPGAPAPVLRPGTSAPPGFHLETIGGRPTFVPDRPGSGDPQRPISLSPIPTQPDPQRPIGTSTPPAPGLTRRPGDAALIPGLPRPTAPLINVGGVFIPNPLAPPTQRPGGTNASPIAGDLVVNVLPSPSVTPPIVITINPPREPAFPLAGFSGGGGGGGTAFPTGGVDFGPNTDIAGITRRFQRGGIVPGQGPPDSVLARVSPGELLIPPDAVSRLLARLETPTPPARTGPVVLIQQLTVEVMMPANTVLTPDMLTTQLARQVAEKLTPALNEQARRGALRMGG